MPIRRYLLVLVGLTALPLFLLAACLVMASVEAERETLRHDAEAVARHVATLWDRQLSADLGALNTLAASHSLDSPGRLEEFHQEAQALRGPQASSVNLMDGEGQLLLSTRHPLRQPLPRSNAAEAAARVMRSGQPLATDLFHSALVQDYVIGILVPVRRDGENRQVLGLTIGLDKMAEHFGQPPLPEGWGLAVLDSQGRFILRSRNPAPGAQAAPELVAAARSHPAGWVDIVSREGLPLSTVFLHTDLAPWTVAVGIPRASLRAPVIRAALWLGLMALTSLLAGYGLARWMGRRLARGLERLAAEAEAPEPPAPAPPPPASDIAELDEVAGALRRAQAALRASETRLWVAVEAARLHVWEYDIPADRAVWYGSRQAARAHRGQEMSLRHWQERIHPDDRERAAAEWAAALEGRIPAYHSEFRILRGNGAVAWISLHARLVWADGRPRRAIGISRDIGARKAAEEILRQAKEQAEQASRAKTRFLAAASHDLRQPFQAMALFHEVLNLRLTDPADRPVVEGLGRAVASGRDLLDRLLDISALDAGVTRPQPQALPLADILGPLAAEFAPQAAAQGLSLRFVPCSARVTTDPVLLTRMLRNLLNNALRYTRRGSVLLGCRRRGRQIRLVVQDTGPGIPADKQAEIWEEFSQLDNPRREGEKGLGLGLAIVARTGRLLNHPVGLRSRPGRGSAFHIDLPQAGFRSGGVRPAAETASSESEAVPA